MRIINALANIIMLGFIANACFLGCDYRYKNEYTKYRLESDLGKYEYGVRSLLNRIEETEDPRIRMTDIVELGDYSENKNPGAREILTEIAVPRLIHLLYSDDKCPEKSLIIGALGKIEPDEDLVIPIYIDRLENGSQGEALVSIALLRDKGFDLSGYVPKMVDKILSGVPYEKGFGINALGLMGRYAVRALGILENVRDNDPDAGFRNMAFLAIEHINDDMEDK